MRHKNAAPPDSAAFSRTCGMTGLRLAARLAYIQLAEKPRILTGFLLISNSKLPLKNNAFYFDCIIGILN